MVLEPISTAIGATAAATMLWEACGKTILEELTAKGVEPGVKTLAAGWKSIKWDDTRAKYCERVINDYGQIRMIGQYQSVPLHFIYTDLYILDEIAASRKFDMGRLVRHQREHGKLGYEGSRVAAIRAIDRHDRLFVLGKPGAGKSTFLKHVAVRAARGEINEKIPIIVWLKKWTDYGCDLVPYIEREFAICGFPDASVFIEKLLIAGGAIILFDGLDEVPTQNGKRRHLQNEIGDFLRKYPKCKAVVASRTAATEYIFEGFTYVELADFDEEQWTCFVNKWFADTPELGHEFIKELKRPSNKGVRELADRPLLLSLLCIAYAANRRFAPRRTGLFESALDAMLRQWDAQRDIDRDPIYRHEQIYKGLSIGRKHELFGQIGFNGYHKQEVFFDEKSLETAIAQYLSGMPPGELSVDIDGLAVLKAIEHHHSLFVERADGIYSFSHLSIQEYYAARYIVDTAEQGSIARLVREHLFDDRWREVFVSVASMLERADVLFEEIQKCLDRAISMQPSLTGLFRYADSKAQCEYQDSSEFRMWALGLGLSYVYRMWLLVFSLGLDVDLDLDLARDLDRVRERARSIARDHAIAVERARAWNPASNAARDDAYAQSLDLARDRARALERDLHLVRQLGRARKFANDVSRAQESRRDLARTNVVTLALDHFRTPEFDLNFARELGLVRLATVIDGALSLDNKQAVPRLLRWEYPCVRDDWEQFAGQAGRVIQICRAAELALDCLWAARISNRAEIAFQLLRAPDGNLEAPVGYSSD